MEKTITIEDKEIKLVANGATPRLYRSMFQKDLFGGVASALSPKGELLDSEVFENLAYCMAVQGGLTGVKIEDWLASFDSPTAVMAAVPVILEFWTQETATMSKGKKG